jgi:hypothetical protein
MSFSNLKIGQKVLTYSGNGLKYRYEKQKVFHE